MSHPILVAVTAAGELLDALRSVTRTFERRGGVVLAVFNFTHFDLVHERCAHDRGAFATTPGTLLPAETAMVLGTGPMTRASGHLDWRGTHPDSGDFYFQTAWDVPPAGAPGASAWAFHRLPVPGDTTPIERCCAEGMPIETELLSTSAVAATGDGAAQLYFELLPRHATARSVGALTSGLDVALGAPVIECADHNTPWRRDGQ